MANPEHVPDMDGFDRLTVVLYRTGLSIGVTGVALLAVAPLLPVEAPKLYPVVLLGAQLAALCMHLYDKRIRWLIAASAHLGAWLVLTGLFADLPLVRDAGLGFGFVTLSGFALKEQFCFKVPLLRATPLLLAASLVPLALWPVPWAASVLLGLTTVPLYVLTAAKWRMPLHFDIGDKSAYQV